MPRCRRPRKPQNLQQLLLSDDIFAKSLDELRNEPFTIMAFEYAVMDRGSYYPCEVGAIQFTLAGGIRDAYHTFVSPKPLPFGTFAEAKDHAEESHQIPIMGDFPYWDNDWLGISNRLLAMIGGGYRVFSTSCGDDMKIAAGCLEYLSNQSGSDITSVTVTPIEQLAECIVRRFKGHAGSTDEIAKYLQRPTHDFDPNIRCFYHEQELDSHFCAFATVFRAFFNMVDFMNERGVTEVNPRKLQVPDHFISRYQTVALAFRPTMPATQEKPFNFYDFDRTSVPEAMSVSDVAYSESKIGESGLEMIGNDADSDSGTVVADVSSGSTDVSNRAHAYGSAERSVEMSSDGMISSRSGNDGNRSQAARPRPMVEILEVGVQAPPRPVPKKICGITVEPCNSLTFYGWNKK